MPLELKDKHKPNWIRRFRWLVALTVVCAVIYMAKQSASQLQDSHFDLSQIRLHWWLAAVLSYVVAISFAALFWHRVLHALGQPTTWTQSFRAFYASQLGKYVPGKAMVVVIRTDMIRSEKIQTAPAAASVFVETLTWLFVGSALGGLLVMFLYRDQYGLLIPAAVMALVAGFLTSPPVFQKIAGRFRAISGTGSESLLSGLNWPTMISGWVWLTIGWCFNGFSLWLVIKGIDGSSITLADYPLTLTCVCLATVAGFVSLLPGGIGVRELVMIPLLGARFGSVTAIIAAVAIRLVWLSAEIFTSAIIYLVTRKSVY